MRGDAQLLTAQGLSSEIPERPVVEIAPFKLGLIGVGGFGASHLETIRALEETGEVCLAAVADPFVENLAQQHARLTATGIRWHRDYYDLLRGEELDGIVISTPIPLHDEMLSEALRRTTAKILLEKPALPVIQQLDRQIAQDSARRVRVGFQMIHWPVIRSIKHLLAEGRAGKVRRITVSAGWPRGASYYGRAGWAGRMTWEGNPVFDGPATNAMAHLLHNVMFFAGEGERSFAVPRTVEAQLYRARQIESYDAAWIRADLGGVEFHAALAHCVKGSVPYRLRIDTDRGSLSLHQEGLRIAGDWELEPGPIDAPTDMIAMYRACFWNDPAGLPSLLEDCRGYTLLTSAAFLSSGGIHGVPESSVTRGGEYDDVKGLADYLRAFPDDPKPPGEAGFFWAAKSREVECGKIARVDLE